jgi:hypothetical protein
VHPEKYFFSLIWHLLLRHGTLLTYPLLTGARSLGAKAKLHEVKFSEAKASISLKKTPFGAKSVVLPQKKKSRCVSGRACTSREASVSTCTFIVPIL